MGSGRIGKIEEEIWLGGEKKEISLLQRNSL